MKTSGLKTMDFFCIIDKIISSSYLNYYVKTERCPSFPRRGVLHTPQTVDKRKYYNFYCLDGNIRGWKAPTIKELIFDSKLNSQPFPGLGGFVNNLRRIAYAQPNVLHTPNKPTYCPDKFQIAGSK